MKRIKNVTQKTFEPIDCFDVYVEMLMTFMCLWPVEYAILLFARTLVRMC